jgi:ribosomal protein S18 acetylase RimI-like enzyme
VTIGRMEPGEALSAAKILSYAMLSNPIHVAVFQGQGEAERQYMERRFTRLLVDDPGDVLMAVHERRIVGVLRSIACQGHPRLHETADQPTTVDERALVNREARVAHWVGVWDHHDPLTPHTHLGPVGVLPQFQRRGIGRRLMQRFCARLDSDGRPAFLETDSSGNVRFYERFGFRPAGETLLFGVTIFFMWRPRQE